jgi:hypothetical protein
VDYTYTEATGTSAMLTSPMAGSTLGTSDVIFTWSGGTDVTKYDLLVGNGGPGSADILNTGPTTAMTATVPTLPANGATIYVRLMSYISGTWHSTDYTYTEATGTSAALTSPMPGSTLGTSNVTFNWTAGTNVTKYGLLVGVGGPGSADIFATGSTTALTATVPKLPANGATIYVRLMSDISGSWHYIDYTYTAQ